jgi:hypothetical protein
MRKMIDRETLGAEMRHAAQRRYSFNKLLSILRTDYITTDIEHPEVLDKLEGVYNTLLFMVDERRVRYNKVG